MGLLYAAGVPIVLTMISIKLAPRFININVHQISSCLWKALIPLGEYDATHTDGIKYRYCFEMYRGPMRAFQAGVPFA